MKRMVLCILAAVLLLAAGFWAGRAIPPLAVSSDLPAASSEPDPPPAGWEYDADAGILTIRADFEDMTDPAGGRAYPWTGHQSAVTAVVIEDGVRSIPPMAFYGFYNVRRVQLPQGLRSIGRFAFHGCSFWEIPLSLLRELAPSVSAMQWQMPQYETGELVPLTAAESRELWDSLLGEEACLPDLEQYVATARDWPAFIHLYQEDRQVARITHDQLLGQPHTMLFWMLGDLQVVVVNEDGLWDALLPRVRP